MEWQPISLGRIRCRRSSFGQWPVPTVLRTLARRFEEANNGWCRDKLASATPNFGIISLLSRAKLIGGTERRAAPRKKEGDLLVRIRCDLGAPVQMVPRGGGARKGQGGGGKEPPWGHNQCGMENPPAAVCTLRRPVVYSLSRMAS